MVRALNMNQTLPETGRLSEGLDTSDDLIKPMIVKRSAELRELAALDAEYAPIVDRAVDGYGSAKEAAIDLGHSETHVSYQRDGKKPTPLRDLARLWKRATSFIASVGPIAADHGYQLIPLQRLTRDEVDDGLRRFMLDSPPLLKLFLRELSVRYGVTVEEVLRVMQGK